MSLAGDVALVTGASRGIGRAIALELGARAAIVVGTATTSAGADQVSATLGRAGIRGGGVRLDVRSLESVNEVVDHIQSEYGAPTIVVNNAAITRDSLLLRMKDTQWDEVVETNLRGVYQVTKACLRGMMKQRRGRIINIASVVGLTGNVGQSNYAATKAGIVGFTKSLAREVGPRGITVNAVAPGFIDTDMTRGLPDAQRDVLLASIPLGRLGSAQEVAHAVAFLASPQASYITGETFNVNGGMAMQ